MSRAVRARRGSGRGGLKNEPTRADGGACGTATSQVRRAASIRVQSFSEHKTSKPVRCGSPTLGRFDSGAAPLSRLRLPDVPCADREGLFGEGERPLETVLGRLARWRTVATVWRGHWIARINHVLLVPSSGRISWSWVSRARARGRALRAVARHSVGSAPTPFRQQTPLSPPFKNAEMASRLTGCRAGSG